MKLKNILFCTLVSISFIGCKEDIPSYEELTETKERVFLYMQKAVDGGESLTLFPQGEVRQTKFSVNYGGVGLPASDIQITITKDQSAIDSVNAIRVRNGLEEYEVLPDNAYSVDKMNLVIGKGMQNSDYLTFTYNADVLDLQKKYAIAFRATNDQRYSFNSKGQVLVLTGEVVESSLLKTGWSSSVSVNQSNDGAGAAGLIDNNLETFWHTPWSGTLPNWPFYATINMAKPQNITKIVFSLRHNNGSTAPKEFDLESSVDGNTYTLVQSFTNESKVNGDQITYSLDELLTTQYIRPKFNNGHHDSWMTLAEITPIGYR